MEDIENTLNQGVLQTKEMCSTLKDIHKTLSLGFTLERDVKELFQRMNKVEELSCEIKTAIYPNEILGKKSIFQEIIDIKKSMEGTKNLIDTSLDEKLKPINEKLNTISESNIERNAVDKFKENIPNILLTLLSIISIVVSALNVIYKK